MLNQRIFIKSFILILLICSNVASFSQNRAEIKIVRADQIKDTILLNYYIKNVSDAAFTIYKPTIERVENYIFSISLARISGKKNARYNVPLEGDIDQLLLNQDHYLYLLPDDSVYLTLPLGVEKFYSKLGKAKKKKILIHMAYPSFLKCIDCKYPLLKETLFAEKEITTL